MALAVAARGSVCGWKASQITGAFGSSRRSGKRRNTGLPLARSIRTQRIPGGATNGTLGWSLSAVCAHCFQIGAADPAALGIAAHRPRLVVAEVDAGDDVRRAADEPHVGRAVRGSGLAEQRPVEVAKHGRGAALDHAFHDMDHLERGHRVEQLAASGSAAAASPCRPSRARCNCPSARSGCRSGR